MKPSNRTAGKEQGRPGAGKGRSVDPDRPFPGDPLPDDGPESAADQNFDAAYEGKEHGEGNYQAAKDYGKRVRSFVRSGQVEPAADAAEPRDRDEARDLADAEKQGRSRSKGEDPSMKGHAPSNRR